MTTLLTVQAVHKGFGVRQILCGVSFAVHAKDRVALLGVNGSGKSTLLRLLAEKTGSDGSGLMQRGATASDHPESTPDAGLITHRRGLHLEYVPQEPQLPPDATVMSFLQRSLRHHSALQDELAALAQVIENSDGKQRDDALLRQAELFEKLGDVGGWDVDHEIRGLSASLELPPPDAQLQTLSIGERRRVALAAALLARPELLLLDEPTNHLDARTVEWLETRLLSLPGALVLITHDRYFLDRVATRIFELDRGKLYSYEGNYTRFLEKQAERLAIESTKEHERAMFVRRELDWIRRGPAARSTKQKARIDRFYDAVAQRPGQDDRPASERRMALRLPTGGRLGKTILELREVEKSLGGKLLFSDLTLLLKPGDRIGIVGRNGAGKTTLLRVLLGQLPPDRGHVVTGQNTRISFLDQGREELDDTRSVLEEVAGDHDTVPLEDGPVHVRTFLRMMLFDDRVAEAKVGTLSGGERNRVQLAKLLRRGGNLLILDEPTNDLDLFTLGVLEEALTEFPGCALVVSHDRWFLDHVATGILAFEGNGRVVFHEGSYSTYIERRTAAEAQAHAEPAQPSGPGKKDSPKESPKTSAPATDKKPVPRKRSFAEQRELSSIEETILHAEAAVSTIEQELSDGTIYRDRPAEVPARVAALDAARREVERLYARWQELENVGSR